jgi:hypothetical protein
VPGKPGKPTELCLSLLGLDAERRHFHPRPIASAMAFIDTPS